MMTKQDVQAVLSAAMKQVREDGIADGVSRVAQARAIIEALSEVVERIEQLRRSL